MDKIFPCHSVFAQAQALFFRFLGFLLLLSWFLPLAFYLTYGESTTSVFRLSASLTVTLLLAGLLVRYIFREVRKSSIVLTDDELVRRSPSLVTAISIAETVSFDYVRMPLLGGYGVLRSAQRKIRIPFIYEDLPELIAAIRDRLVIAGNKDAFEPKVISRFVRDARANAVHSLRMRRFSDVVFRISVLAFVSGMFVARNFWSFTLVSATGWAFFTMAFPPAAYLVADRLLLIQDVKSLERDVDLPAPGQAGIFPLVGLAVLCVYLLAGIAVRCWVRG